MQNKIRRTHVVVVPPGSLQYGHTKPELYVKITIHQSDGWECIGCLLLYNHIDKTWKGHDRAIRIPPRQVCTAPLKGIPGGIANTAQGMD